MDESYFEDLASYVGWQLAPSIEPGSCVEHHDLRQEPYAVVPHVRICGGGGG